MSEEGQLNPFMDEEGLSCFKENIERSQCYLEYGSGVSTVYAATIAKVPVVISVETDLDWINKIAPSLSNLEGLVHLIHCNIGEIKGWGYPKSSEHIGKYWSYMAMPWNRAKEKGFNPDLILVDGRFRVASFLFSLISAAEGTRIMFDDYNNRPEYHVVEDFALIEEKRGRMGVFRAMKDFSLPKICEKIAQYSIIPD